VGLLLQTGIKRVLTPESHVIRAWDAFGEAAAVGSARSGAVAPLSPGTAVFSRPGAGRRSSHRCGSTARSVLQGPAWVQVTFVKWKRAELSARLCWYLLAVERVSVGFFSSSRDPPRPYRDQWSTSASSCLSWEPASTWSETP